MDPHPICFKILHFLMHFDPATAYDKKWRNTFKMIKFADLKMLGIAADECSGLHAAYLVPCSTPTNNLPGLSKITHHSHSGNIDLLTPILAQRH